MPCLSKHDRIRKPNGLLILLHNCIVDNKGNVESFRNLTRLKSEMYKVLTLRLYRRLVAKATSESFTSLKMRGR